MDPFQRLWDRVRDPRIQMDLAVLYLVVSRDLGGVVLDASELVELMAKRHRWQRGRTRDRLDRLVDCGLVACERGLTGDRVYRLVD